MRLPAILATMLVLAVPANSLANDAIPRKTAQLRELLSKSSWETVEPGMALIVVVEPGMGVTALAIDPGRFRFAIVAQHGENGETVKAFGEREDAVLAVNGGFFAEEAPGKGLRPVGLLRIGGISRSGAWSKLGGYLLVGNEELTIVPSSQGVPDGSADVIQSKPVLIEPGGRWAMNTNLEHLRRRTIVCLRADGEVVIALITGLGMSLFEAGWLMRDMSAGGYFGCDSAIAMDGGGSSQLWFAARPELAIFGDGGVHNALVVRRRQR